MAIKNPFANLSKTQKYAVIGGGVLVTGFLVYDHHKNTGSWNPWSSTSTASTSSAANSATSAGNDPLTGLPYSDDSATDPLTGLQYLAEAQEYGSVANAEAEVSAYGQSTATGSGIPVNEASGIAVGSANTVTGTSVYTSNAAWAQAATAGLADVGYNETDVATALGAYLTQSPLTAAEASLVNTAIAEYGAPPVGTLQVILASTTTTGTTSTGTVQVPDVVGQTAGNAHNAISAAGLVPYDPNASRSSEPQDPVTATSPTAGSSVAAGSKVTLTTAPYVAVPKIAGTTAGNAHNALVAAGLDPIAAASQKPGDKVTGSSPAAGAQVPKQSKVTILT